MKSESSNKITKTYMYVHMVSLAKFGIEYGILFASLQGKRSLFHTRFHILEIIQTTPMNARILDSVDATKNSCIQWTTVSPTSQNLESSMEYSS